MAASDEPTDAGPMGEDLPEEKAARLRTFLEVTHTQPQDAVNILESCNWSLEEALELFVTTQTAQAASDAEQSQARAGNGLGPSPSPSSSSSSSSSASSPVASEGLRQRSAAAVVPSSSASPPVSAEAVAVPVRDEDASVMGMACRILGQILSLLLSASGAVFRTLGSLFLPSPNSTMAFAASFENKFGLAHPKFYAGTFNEALAEARSAGKLLVVFLHSTVSADSTAACRDILTSNQIIQLLDVNFIFWAADVGRLEGHGVSRLLRVNRLPHLSVVVSVGGQVVRQLQVLEGAMDLDHVTAALLQGIDHLEAHIRTIDEREKRRHDDRRLREEQDREFQEALERDAAKRRVQAAEDARQAAAEEELRLAGQRAKDRQAARAAAAAILASQCEEYAKEFRAEDRERVVQPLLKHEQTRICLKLPSGRRVERTFRRDDKVEWLYRWAQCSPVLCKVRILGGT
eukprot:GHVT01018979.1.p1 GENE.GHVT01018979.1~~GHVT01018979.1.p1  ORF type:complete len:461 (-),score=125.33 GHVT01018979.1:140-1522(-)